MKWEVHIKYVLGSWRRMIVSKILLWLSCEMKYPLSSLDWIFLERTISRQTMVTQILVFGRHCLRSKKEKKKKRMKQAYLFKENNWQYLLPMIKFKLSNKNWNLGKLVFVIISLTAFQYLKTFLERFVVILTNMMFWYYIIKSVKMWKIWISQYSHIFQMDDQYVMLQNHKKIHSKTMWNSGF